MKCKKKKKADTYNCEKKKSFKIVTLFNAVEHKCCSTATIRIDQFK